jgi:hypothetical protein
MTTCRVLALCLLVVTAGDGRWMSTAWARTPIRGDGTTDPAFDWENPPPPMSPDWYGLTTFKSTRTLAQTTKWLKDALERYGRRKAATDDVQITNVRFSGCAMEWTSRQELSGGVTQVSTFAVNLRDVDLARGAVQVFTETVKFRTKSEFTVINTYFEKGVQKPTGTDKESSAQLRMRDADRMPMRVSWALVHAARLCGAEVPAPR